MTLGLAAVSAQAKTPAVVAFTQEQGFCGTFNGGAAYTGESVSVQYSKSISRAIDSMPELAVADAFKTVTAACAAYLLGEPESEPKAALNLSGVTSR